MARDPVERVLQALCYPQKEAGPAADFSSYRWRILAHTEDVDGQVEGLVIWLSRTWVTDRLCAPDRLMIGEQCRVGSLLFDTCFRVESLL
jgi:hypothetical protein